jgi:hypothetical protein
MPLLGRVRVSWRALLAALVVVLAASAAHAQTTTLIVQGSDDVETRQWVTALRAHLASSVVVTLDPTGCWPEDATCAAQYMQRAHAQRLLYVRLIEERAGCAPVVGGGTVMLVETSLEVSLMDASGTIVGRQYRASAAVDDTARDAASLAIVTALGLP